MQHVSDLTVGVLAGAALVGLCSVPALTEMLRLLGGRRSSTMDRHDPAHIYEDEDGKSTRDAVATFSNRLSKFLVLFFSSLGCAASLVLGVLVTQGRGRVELFAENWLTAGCWALLLFQAIVIAASRKPVRAYQLGLYSFTACFILSIVLLVQATRVAEYLLRHEPVLFAFGALELFAVIALAVASLSLPRRPDVFDEDGQLVDQMLTVSAFSRYTWSWAEPSLKLARIKNNLDLVDLGRPDHSYRAREVSADWKRRGYSHRLWLSILRAHLPAIGTQWALVLVSSVLNFAPQWVILQLLRILENSPNRTGYGVDTWMWVFYLGAAIVAQNWIESHIYWLSWAELTIPIRSQLSSLIFEKAMRKKDIKGASKGKKKGDDSHPESSDSASATPVNDGAAENGGNQSKGEEDEEEDAAEALKKSKQSVVNLIGVDAKRISDFASYQYLFPGSLAKLIVSLSFLVTLLGWKPLLAGFSTMIAIMPVNIYFSKKYSAAQDRLMKVRDEKMAVVTEALQGIRQIKFSALEPEWEDKVGKVREKELECVWMVYLYDTALISCWITSPVLLSAASLAVYALLNNELTPSVAFVSLGVFKALEVTLSVVPELTTDLLDSWISVNRIEEYLNGPDVEKMSKDSEDITFDKASIAWPSNDQDDDERFVLRDVSLTFPRGELSVISGKTGTGKSLLLSAILGEVDVLAGDLYLPRGPAIGQRHDAVANGSNWILPNSIAYVAQIPWIENASIRDNILFGLPVDEERYKLTIEVCALKKDMEMLPDGENTEIGAQGVNLSGGQRWRVTLARAMYSRAGILVMDDIFSAVDAHVGRYIFERCLNGELAAGRTRILVTHHVALVESKTKFIVELGEGRVLNSGFVSELQEEGVLQKIKSHEQSQREIRQEETQSTAATTAVNSDSSTDDGDDEEQEGQGNTLKRVTSKSIVPRKFVEEEAREKGAVRKHIYTTYLHDSGGWIYWIFALCIFISTQTLNLCRSWWLRIWTGDNEQSAAGVYDLLHQALNTSSSAMHLAHSNYNSPYGSNYLFSYMYGPHQGQVPLQGGATMPFVTTASTTSRAGEDGQSGSPRLLFYLGIYVVLALMTSVFGSLKFLYIYIGSIKASRRLFQKMNFVILHAPLRWLDTVPLGRILNRFTGDFNIVDSSLANSLSFGANSFLGLFAVVAAGMFLSPTIVLFALVLLAICTYYALLYLTAARPVKRLESTTKSPVFEQFSSALTGVATIRGFDKAQVYIEKMQKKVDDWSVSTWNLWLFNRWMGWRMALVGSMFAVFVAILILVTPGIDAALAGFALAFSLEFASCVIWTIRLYANVELNMNAAERIIEYSELQTESLEGELAPAAWPTKGHIEVNDLVVSYASDLPPVLKGITFTVEGSQRIGVVGRTGAGKSSLTLALFRFLEARSGSILIDGLDISKIRLHDLRSRLAIIPQDPVLFSGTVRSNLDPFGNHTDAELRDSLLRVHLVSPPSVSGDATPTATVPQSAAEGEHQQQPGGVQSSAASSTGASSESSAAKNLNVFENLDSPISEGGLNLSQGQRQLLCLARAIVSRPRVMVLDEATSAVDMTTDALIQRSIREEFNDASLVVIAHRLSTIADFDRILVLSDGTVAEFGSPSELWEKGEMGAFRAMCEESGERDKLRAIIFGGSHGAAE